MKLERVLRKSQTKIYSLKHDILFFAEENKIN